MNKLHDRFNDFIAKRGLKSTAQRGLIVDVFLKTEGHLSTEELYEKVKSVDNSVGQATVYRTMKLLCESGLAREVHFGDGLARYEKYNEDHDHHDHLICQSCGKNLEVVDERIESLQEELAKQHGFVLTSHRMYLYGVCSDCRKSKKLDG